MCTDRANGNCNWVVNEFYAEADGSMGNVKINAWAIGQHLGKRKLFYDSRAMIISNEVTPRYTKDYQPMYMCSIVSNHKFRYASEGCSPSHDSRCLRSDFVAVDNGPGPQARKAFDAWDGCLTCYVTNLFCGKLLTDNYCEAKRRGGCFHESTMFQKKTEETVTPTAVTALEINDEILMLDMDSGTAKFATVIGFAVRPKSTCYDAAALEMFSFVNIDYQINGDIIGVDGDLVDESDPLLTRYITTKRDSSSFSVTPAHSLAVVRNG